MTIDPCVERAFASAVISAAIAVYDYSAGPNVSLWFLYIAPIALAAWGCGLRAAVTFAGLSGSLILLVDALVGHPYPSTAEYAFAVGGQILTLAAIAGMAGYIHDLLKKLKGAGTDDER